MTEPVEQGSNPTKRPLRYGLVSALLALAGLGGVVLVLVFKDTSWLGGLGLHAFVLLEVMAFFAALLGAIRVAWCAATKRGRTLLSLEDGILLIVGGALSLVVVMPIVNSLRPQDRHASMIACSMRLDRLDEAMTAYRRTHSGRYPTPEKWCDLLMAEDQTLPPGAFQCPREKGRCLYAMNPLVDPCSAPDVVLLFECHAGWNQCGGPEMLVLRHQQGKSGGVLFVNGQVEFIGAEEVPLLRWEGKASGI